METWTAASRSEGHGLGDIMGTATAAPISLDRFRRRRATGHRAAAYDRSLTGVALGTIERRYGLMSSEEQVVIDQVVATSGDLAVADRMAFMAAMEHHIVVAVVEVDGWYVACTTERTIAPSEAHALRSSDGAPRLMSLVSSRGIAPALGPLGA